jgi:hypothetical protein
MTKRIPGHSNGDTRDKATLTEFGAHQKPEVTVSQPHLPSWHRKRPRVRAQAGNALFLGALGMNKNQLAT